MNCLHCGTTESSAYLCSECDDQFKKSPQFKVWFNNGWPAEDFETLLAEWSLTVKLEELNGGNQ